MTTPNSDLIIDAREQTVVAPGVHDPMSARLAAEAGFKWLYVTGAGVANARFGRPDIGIVDVSELAEAVSTIGSAVPNPLIVDLDTGFGGIQNIAHAVRSIEDAGASAIHIEDQIFPKRCGYLPGGGIVSCEEMEQRLRVAIDSRSDSGMRIIARCEARLAGDLDDVVRRGISYMETGADMMFVNGIRSVEDAAEITKRIPGPHLYNYSGSDESPLLKVDEVSALGYSVIIFPIHALRRSIEAMRGLFEAVARTGDMAPHLKDMIPFDEWQRLTGFHSFAEAEDNYQSGARD